MKAIRRRTFEILGASGPEDRASYRCDLALITLIVLNVVATVLESVPGISDALRGFFHRFELFSVVLFSVEYLLRVWCSV